MKIIKISAFILFLIFCLNFIGCMIGLDYNARQWMALDQRPFGSFNDVPGNYAIIVGDSGYVATSEGRYPAPWNTIHSGVSQKLNAVSILKIADSTVAYAVGDQGTVLRSVDKGQTWQIINEPVQNFPNFNGLSIIPSNSGMTHIMIAGNNGKVFMTTTSGVNWVLNDRSVNTTKKLNSIAVAFTGLYVVVGDSGAIYRTIDGGANWVNRSISVGISLKRVVSTRYDSYCAVGSNGVIYTSTDYGFTWVLRNSSTTQTFNDVIFSGIDSGIAVGNNKVVRVTTNGGVTWQSNPSIDSLLNTFPNRNIISITRVDENTVNTISRSPFSDLNSADTSFIVSVSSEPFLGLEPISNYITKIFSLKQNFPNPFNPVTKIRFDVPANVKAKESNVMIIIYDINGKEIEILVNEALRPGQYEIQWNGAKYASGVYFYKIVSDVFTETRKMVLIK